MSDDLVCPQCKTDHGEGVPPGPPMMQLLACGKCGYVREGKWTGLRAIAGVKKPVVPSGQP